MNHKIAGQQTDGHIKNFPDFRYIRLINQQTITGCKVQPYKICPNLKWEGRNLSTKHKVKKIQNQVAQPPPVNYEKMCTTIDILFVTELCPHKKELLLGEWTRVVVCKSQGHLKFSDNYSI